MSETPKRVARSPDQQALYEKSGEVTVPGRLTAFLYLLMRDHLPTGVVSGIVQELEPDLERNYTNGWLARYAEHLAEELTKP